MARYSEIIRASAEELVHSDLPIEQLVGRIALLEPTDLSETHRLGARVRARSKWSFVYFEAGHPEKNEFTTLGREISTDKKGGRLAITGSFYEALPGDRHFFASLKFPDRGGVHLDALDAYGDGGVMALRRATQIVEDVEMGLLTPEEDQIRTLRSLQGLYRNYGPDYSVREIDKIITRLGKPPLKQAR